MVDWAAIAFPKSPPGLPDDGRIVGEETASIPPRHASGWHPSRSSPPPEAHSSRRHHEPPPASSCSLPPSAQSEGTDPWLLRAAAMLAGLINTGGEVQLCPSGGIDAWDVVGRYRGFSPNVVARLRAAALLPAALKGRT